MYKHRYTNLSPSQLLIIVFLFFISVGTILLKLPMSTTESISWINALFTAVSAMTCTGLVVVDTPVVFTGFGQIVIVCLIQLGGLGIMSFGVLIYMMLGKKISLKQRIVLQQSLNQTSVGGIIKLIKYLFIFSITIEAAGMLFLSSKWIPEYGLAKGIYFSFFHAISAFNNAGFALWSDNLIRYVGDPIVNIGITLLFIIGGIGFTVLIDMRHAKSFQKLSLHSKIMIIGTLIVNVAAVFVFFVLEYSNPQTLGGLTSLSDKLWGAYFQGVVPRTAGFNTLEIANLNQSTAFFMIILMFVGAGSASTGGGIKLTTLMVIVFSVIAFLKGKQEVVISWRTIPMVILFRSLAILSISIFFVVAAVFILSISEQAPFIVVLFEVASAFGTVGISMDFTASMTMLGKIVIIFMMFLGKVGPLTIVMFFNVSKPTMVKYPKEDILTG